MISMSSSWQFQYDIHMIIALDPCEDGYENFGDHCYRMETVNKLSYSAAVTACEDDNATLGTPPTGNIYSAFVR